MGTLCLATESSSAILMASLAMGGVDWHRRAAVPLLSMPTPPVRTSQPVTLLPTAPWRARRGSTPRAMHLGGFLEDLGTLKISRASTGCVSCAQLGTSSARKRRCTPCHVAWPWREHIAASVSSDCCTGGACVCECGVVYVWMCAGKGRRTSSQGHTEALTVMSRPRKRLEMARLGSTAWLTVTDTEPPRSQRVTCGAAV